MTAKVQQRKTENMTIKMILLLSIISSNKHRKCCKVYKIAHGFMFDTFCPSTVTFDILQNLIGTQWTYFF